MTKHTPTKWFIWDKDLELSDETGLHMPLITSEGGEDIAEVYKDNDHWQANARLIAAAPKLLEACKTALSGFAYRADNGDEEALMDAKLLEQAINEAERKEV